VEVTHLVQQIKENTASLYNGSKDIIWSLSSRNDGLYEVTEHIKDIGMDLFNETAIDFNYNHNVNSYNSKKLKLDYSRNLTMIFKEAYSNILKYSKATKVDVKVMLADNNELQIKIEDNGTGFDKAAVETGNGLRNMENRVKRMNGEINIASRSGLGTQIFIHLKTIFI
jgi:signal transduction histidine kinase